MPRPAVFASDYKAAPYWWEATPPDDQAAGGALPSDADVAVVGSGYTGLHASGTLPPTVTGSMMIGPDSQGGPWPLPPGEYVVHYLLTDRYRSAASATFEVTDSGSP